jgi:N-acetylglutamate synthase-like GNAT family acetyltransferase
VTERQQRPVPVPLPLAVFEREGLAAALAKAGLSNEDLQSEIPLFWRFESSDVSVPVGFGGLEIFGDQALMRAVVTLPPVRNRGIGSDIVALLETEARIRGCRTVWLSTQQAEDFFARLGYRACERSDAPKPVREAAPFAQPVTAKAMMKRLD